jgi:hypothetical protein
MSFVSKIYRENSNPSRITVNVREDQYTFFIISHSFLLKIRNVSDVFCREIKIHILLSVMFFENSAVHEIMWENTVQPERAQMEIWHMPISRLPEATNTHAQNM